MQAQPPWAHCDAMLRTGHAPVAYRGPRLVGASVERYGVNTFAAPAPAAPPPLQLLGFRHALRRHSLAVHAPLPAPRTRRGSLLDVSFLVRCSEERAAEVRPSSAACLSAILTSACRVTGFAGWRARQSVGEAHGRGGRALR